MYEKVDPDHQPEIVVEGGDEERGCTCRCGCSCTCTTGDQAAGQSTKLGSNYMETHNDRALYPK